ncbi:hypothetical protein [Castellaniella sp.]|uniref:hypothetical protein n=1 Tax=Castellaniella sp. TaxID=1955812 RepID=UPI003C721FF2
MKCPTPRLAASPGPSKEDVAAWRAAMPPVWTTSQAGIGKDLIDAAQASNQPS